jgi:hypothetical protein
LTNKKKIGSVKTRWGFVFQFPETMDGSLKEFKKNSTAQFFKTRLKVGTSRCCGKVSTAQHWDYPTQEEN